MLRNLEIDAKESELRRVRERHFLARSPKQKAKCRDEDAKLRAAIAEMLKDDGWDTATARKLASWNPYNQNASADFFDREWMFGMVAGFDVIIGNPPYVGKQALQQQQPAFVELAKRDFKVAKGRDFDLFALFIERSLGLLSAGGDLCLIVPTGWYTGPGFSVLRRHILTHSDLCSFVNLPYSMFDEAWVDTTVCHMTRRDTVTAWPRKEPCQAWLKNFQKREKLVDQGQFYEDRELVEIVDWLCDGGDEFLTRSSPAMLRLLDKINKHSVSLAEYADVQRGVTPFKITEKPTHKNSKLAFNGVLRRYTADIGEVGYIRFDDSLAEFKAERYFVGRRILMRELISRQMRLQACIVNEDFVTNKSMQSILSLRDSSELNFILGVINSRLLSWCFLQRSNVGHRNDFPKIVLKETRSLPMPKPGLLKENDFSRLVKMIDSAVEKILENKRRNHAADTLTLEGEVDQHVYDLFGLTPEDILIVEKSS